MKIFLILSFFLMIPLFAQDALIWGGPGACQDGCVEGATFVAQKAGLTLMIVTPENYDSSLFEKAKIWIQPGGKSSIASKAMGEKIRADLRDFIHQGGGYVGFCAGAFLTTPKVGKTRQDGLGIIPGKTAWYRKAQGSPSVETLITNHGEVYHYWEGGPYFSFTKNNLPSITVTSRYKKTNQINGVFTKFGKGKIWVTGTHPEAPNWWYEDAGLKDQDGLDHNEAVKMIQAVLK